MDCPQGHGPMIRGRKGWVCEECGHRLAEVADDRLQLDVGVERLPYPVALTARRLQEALGASGDVLTTLFKIKDCFEAAIKYLGAILLVDYLGSPAATPERNEQLLKKLVRPSLGVWVNSVVGNLSAWSVAHARSSADEASAASRIAPLFYQHGKAATATTLLNRCRQFVDYRNDALGQLPRPRR